ncbi:MAG: peptidoglycan editing factor PgeF [Rhodospirillaceae bacterium]|jgi:hypothetical protein|nr:peptidoglycan editing factor PgeF [Rhodospirillaceae bacterium]
MLQIKQFNRKNIQHAFFTRHGGKSTGLYTALNCGIGSNDNISSVLDNRAQAMKALNLSAGSLVTCHQTHSSKMIVITKANRYATKHVGDGLVTSLPKVCLGILTADCSPILFSDEKNRVIGAAHAGWKGALHGILEATVNGMGSQGAEIDHIVCAIGPTIGPKSYEVGPEFKETFLDSDSTCNQFFAKSSRLGHYMFDLPSFIISRLSKIGINTVFNIDRDTYSDETSFYSYRRSSHKNEDDYGRLLSTIVINQK